MASHIFYVIYRLLRRMPISLCVKRLPSDKAAVDVDGFMHYKTSYRILATTG